MYCAARDIPAVSPGAQRLSNINSTVNSNITNDSNNRNVSNVDSNINVTVLRSHQELTFDVDLQCGRVQAIRK